MPIKKISKKVDIPTGTDYISLFFYSTGALIKSVVTPVFDLEKKPFIDSKILLAELTPINPCNTIISESLVIETNKLKMGDPAVIDLTFINITRNEDTKIGYLYYFVSSDSEPGEPEVVEEEESLSSLNIATIHLVFSHKRESRGVD